MLMKAPQDESFADLLHRLGDISPARIRLRPAPGTATIKDVVRIERRENRLYELVDGVLVEKTMGFTESRIAILLASALQQFIEVDDLGVITGPDGMIRLPENLVRMPDVAFVSWSRFPDGQMPREPVPQIVPDLAIEVLSVGNTEGEMSRKLREYFRAGVPLVWIIDPKTESATVYSSLTRAKQVSPDGTLDGGKVLPGFQVSLKDLFAKLRRRQVRGSKTKRRKS
jgi:Uma2 family endonuclease